MRALPLALALLVAGCSGSGGATDPAAGPGTLPPPAAPAPLPVAGDGKLAFGLCGDTVVAGPACVFNVGDPTDPFGTKAGNILHFPAANATGLVAKATATATWQPVVPVLDQVALRVSILAGCPGHCSTGTVVKEVTGTSPLSVEVADVEVPDGMTLGFSVTRAEVMGTGQRASVLQPFHVEGTVEMAPAAAPEPAEPA
jgi:hypothetical protein